MQPEAQDRSTAKQVAAAKLESYLKDLYLFGKRTGQGREIRPHDQRAQRSGTGNL